MKKVNIALMMFMGLGLFGCGTTTMAAKAQRGTTVASCPAQVQRERCELCRAKRQLQQEQARVDELSKANQDLSNRLQSEIAAGQVRIHQEPNRLTVSLTENVLFDSGSAALRPEGKRVLDQVAGALTDVRGEDVMIEGHTDDVPISAAHRAKFPSNWELSTARSTTVVRYLESKGVNPDVLGAAGFSKYRPAASNDTAEGRQENRRIDVVLTPKLQERSVALSSIPSGEQVGSRQGSQPSGSMPGGQQGGAIASGQPYGAMQGGEQSGSFGSGQPIDR